MSGGVMSWDFALGGFGLGRLASIIIRLKEDGTQCNRANIKREKEKNAAKMHVSK